MPASQETRIAFQLAGGKQPLILLPVFVSGRGPYSFILDTGAGISLVSSELAAALELQPGEQITGRGAAGEMTLVKSVLPSLSIGDETLSDVIVAITDLSFVGRAIGTQVDGDLGYTVLQHFSLTLDYAENTLTLVRPSTNAPATHSNGLSFRLANPPEEPHVVIPAFLNGQGPYDFLVDTGASSTVVSLELAKNLGLPLEAIPEMTGGGGRVSAFKSALESLVVGSAKREALRVAVSDFLEPLSQTIGTKLHGIVGYNFLREFRVTFDYPAGLLLFDR